MKKNILFLILSIGIFNFCFSQEWLTSLETAKRVALVQNKFLLMIWEDAALIPYPVLMNDEKGNTILVENLFDYDEINRVIWDYFVPVKLNERVYSELYEQIKNTRSRTYMAQFEDDNIKIVDVNLNIINTSDGLEAYSNLSKFLSKYALNTSFLNADLRNYLLQKDFGSAFRLASKYFDYAILVHNNVREDIIQISDLYLDEAIAFLPDSRLEERSNFEQKAKLLGLSKFLLKNKPGKVQRQLKKIQTSEIDQTNKSLLAFLYYTSYQLQKDEKNAELWKSEVSLVDLKRAELIIKLQS